VDTNVSNGLVGGALLRHARITRRLSLGDVSRQLGISQKVLRRIERGEAEHGEYRPKDRTVFAVADFFEVDVFQAFPHLDLQSSDPINT
jgi:transcriptional regulator with XRE-family HTH domain